MYKFIPALLLAGFTISSQNSIIERKLKEAEAYRNRPEARRASSTEPSSVAAYSVTSIPFSPYAYTGTATNIGTDDIYSSAIPLGFNFCFFGRYYNNVVIGSNGNLTFELSVASGYDNYSITTPLPSLTNLPGNSICAVFRDIDNAIGGKILYNTVGVAPNRIFIVSWDSVPLFNNSCNICTCHGTPFSTFQAALYEGSNNIDVFVDSSASCSNWNGGYGIIGIQDSTAANGITPPNRNYPNTWTGIHEGWRFSQSLSTSCACTLADSSKVCFVTTDTNLHNEVYFNHNPSLSTGPMGTIIYRMNNSSLWDSIGFVPYNQPDKFIDLVANPNQQSYSYCVAARDSCQSPKKSPPHTTVFLQYSQGGNNQINLSWNPYLGVLVNSYYIYRGATPSALSLIAQVSSMNFAYTDLNPPAGPNYYRIGFTTHTICTSNAPHDSLIGSNFRTMTISGIASYRARGSLQMYPNPVTGFLTLESAVALGNVVVINYLGQTVMQIMCDSHRVKIDLTTFPSGIYFVQAAGEVGKIIKTGGE